VRAATQTGLDGVHRGPTIPTLVDDLDAREPAGEVWDGPSSTELDEVLASHPTGPLQLLYLVKFRERALYPPDYQGDEPTDCTGPEAYQRFGDATMPLVMEGGGRIVLISGVDTVLFGEGGWDLMAIIEYPSAQAYAELSQSPEALAARVHRKAGLERLDVIATTPVIHNSTSWRDAGAEAPGAPLSPPSAVAARGEPEAAR
jgi:uncharacterized protein (DUF1330 family)